MDISKAVQHLRRKVGLNKYSSDYDKECMQAVIDYVNKKQIENIVDNQLFGKLYIYLYGQFIKHYQTTVFDPIPQKELHKILDKPVRVIVQEFVDAANESELYQDATGKTATWEYEQMAENLRVMVNKSLETYN